MPFTQATDLGRRVLLEDWRSFHRDRILSMLYTLRDAGDVDGLTYDQICNITGLPRPEIPDLVLSMTKKPKLVEITIHHKVAITARGIRWVEESPRHP